MTTLPSHFDEDIENNCRVINLAKGPASAPAPAESKWWLEENSAAAKRSLQARNEAIRQKTEKDRYLKALRALVDEKGGANFVDGGRIPDLCSCGQVR